MASKRFDRADFEAFLKLLPPRLGGRSIRHAVEVRHDSFKTPDFIALARRYRVAVVTAADSDYPQIADATAPFVYARIMGTVETEAQGYADGTLDLWARRVQDWAAGKPPAGLDLVCAPPARPAKREVFLYVISGHKIRNPAAAMALIDRLGR